MPVELAEIITDDVTSAIGPDSTVESTTSHSDVYSKRYGRRDASEDRPRRRRPKRTKCFWSGPNEAIEQLVGRRAGRLNWPSVLLLLWLAVLALPIFVVLVLWYLVVKLPLQAVRKSTTVEPSSHPKAQSRTRKYKVKLSMEPMSPNLVPTPDAQRLERYQPPEYDKSLSRELTSPSTVTLLEGCIPGCAAEKMVMYKPIVVLYPGHTIARDYAFDGTSAKLRSKSSVNLSRQVAIAPQTAMPNVC